MKKTMRKKILPCFLIVFLVVFVVDRSEAIAPAAIIPIAAVGSVLIAGAAMTPQQKQDFYQDVREGVTHIADTTSGIVRNVWQAEMIKNELGFEYLVGRGAQLYTDMRDFIDAAYDNASAVSQWLQDLLANNAEDARDPISGDIIECTGDYTGTYQLTGSGYQVFTFGSVPSWLPPSGCGGGKYFWQLLSGKSWYYFGITEVVDQDITYPPPGGFSPDYPAIEQGIRDQIDYAPAIITDDYDEIIKRNPGIGKPIDPAAEDPATAPPIADIPVNEIPAVNPSAVPVDGESTVATPDPAIDNELLRGIYNNTFATARNTHTTNTLLQDGITVEAPEIDLSITVEAPEIDLSPVVTAINTQGNAIQDKLSDIDDKLVADYDSADLPAANTYDPTIEDLPEEEDFTDTVNNFLSTAPFLGSIRNSTLTLQNANACLSGNVLNQEISVCFDDYESTWNAMGYVFVGCASLFAFFIIIGKS